MVGEIAVGIGIFKTIIDTLRGLKNANDASVRLAAINELQEQVNAALMHQSELIAENAGLKERLAAQEGWEEQKKRYQLQDFGGGTFAYALRVEAANGEPDHRLCTSCFAEGRKSILQFTHRTIVDQDHYLCPSCKTEFDFGQQVIPQEPVVAPDYDPFE